MEKRKGEKQHQGFSSNLISMCFHVSLTNNRVKKIVLLLYFSSTDLKMHHEY